jgi:hypothetical protein
VLKHGVGVRDAWAQQGVKQKEIDGAFLDAAVVDQFTIAPDFLPTAIGHFLAVGHLFGSAWADQPSGAARHHRGRSRSIRPPRRDDGQPSREGGSCSVGCVDGVHLDRQQRMGSGRIARASWKSIGAPDITMLAAPYGIMRC